MNLNVLGEIQVRLSNQGPKITKLSIFLDPYVLFTSTPQFNTPVTSRRHFDTNSEEVVHALDLCLFESDWEVACRSDGCRSDVSKWRMSKWRICVKVTDPEGRKGMALVSKWGQILSSHKLRLFKIAYFAILEHCKKILTVYNYLKKCLGAALSFWVKKLKLNKNF